MPSHLTSNDHADSSVGQLAGPGQHRHHRRTGAARARDPWADPSGGSSSPAAHRSDRAGTVRNGREGARHGSSPRPCAAPTCAARRSRCPRSSSCRRRTGPWGSRRETPGTPAGGPQWARPGGSRSGPVGSRWGSPMRPARRRAPGAGPSEGGWRDAPGRRTAGPGGRGFCGGGAFARRLGGRIEVTLGAVIAQLLGGHRVDHCLSCAWSPGTSTRSASAFRGCWSCWPAPARYRLPSGDQVRPDAFPAEELAEAGYGAVHHSAGQWSGVAVLARSELQLTEAALELPGDPVRARRGGARSTSTVFTSPACTYQTAAGWTTRSSRASWPSWMPWPPGCRSRKRRAAADRRRLQRRAGRPRRLRPGGVRRLHPRHPRGARPADRRSAWSMRTATCTPMRCSTRGGITGPGTSTADWGCGSTCCCVDRAIAETVIACGIARDYRKGKKPSDHAPLLLELA